MFFCLFQVSLSMLEIYNEQVRDLLNAKSMTVKGGLKVRQHPTKGFYGNMFFIARAKHLFNWAYENSADPDLMPKSVGINHNCRNSLS